MTDCLGDCYLVKSRGFVILVALGLVSIMLHDNVITVNTVVPQDLRLISNYKDAQDRLLWRHKTCSART